ncbi:low-density lipoprotein receptor class A domain-containing protein 2 isoform X1 [Malaclemys terrapin pileata]|uniref:low-density lipoprotein receptor class A domain-containing protein 2 isoform X1 n=1 Tax=Malaclemys terrapin pileata TaxID=2991368 RepID=UPI0023A85D82|nr:low-density lipoprotein receptor class A domain-containing protein 2 isoform X1 [Malaclemys terrapin pileata]
MGGHLHMLSKWLVLLNFTALEVSSIETVNLVDFCGQTIRDDGLIINSHRDSRRYYFVATGTDCSLTMQAASPKDKVQFQFRFFLVYSLLRLAPSGGPPSNTTRAPLPPETARPSQRGPGQPSSGGDWELQDPCNAGSYVQFYDGRGRAAEPLGFPLCGKSIPRPILSTGNYLTLRLVTRGQQPRVDFVGDFTSFRLGFNMSECSEEPYFQCRNSKCIPMSLVCDRMGIDNCGDGSDQAAHPPAKCRGRPPTSAFLQPASSPAAHVTPCMAACGGAEKSQPLAPDTAPQDEPAAALPPQLCPQEPWLFQQSHAAAQRRPAHLRSAMPSSPWPEEQGSDLSCLCCRDSLRWLGSSQDGLRIRAGGVGWEEDGAAPNTSSAHSHRQARPHALLPWIGSTACPPPATASETQGPRGLLGSPGVAPVSDAGGGRSE